MTATVDMRISINTDLNEFEQQVLFMISIQPYNIFHDDNLSIWILISKISWKKLSQWCQEAGGNITIDYIARKDREKLTKVDDTNPFWMAFKSVIDTL